jgi:hypothetical protein
MNPNPYRTALLALGVVSIFVGGLFFLIGVTGADIATSFSLGAVGGFLFSGGITLLTLWLVVSAMIYGLTVTHDLAPRPTAGEWLGLTPGTRARSVPPSHLDEDGL